MKLIPPDGFYPFKWQKLRDPNSTEKDRLRLCPNCSAWFQYELTHYHVITSGNTLPDIPVSSNGQWAILQCNWCQARVWCAGHYDYSKCNTYYEPRPVEIARNPLKFDYNPDVGYPIEPPGLVFGKKVLPEFLKYPVTIKTPSKPFTPADLDRDLDLFRHNRHYVQTEWTLPDLVGSVWLNCWTLSTLMNRRLYYTRFGYPNLAEDENLGWSLGLGCWRKDANHQDYYEIEHWFRIDHLPIAEQYEFLKVAVKRGRCPLTELHAFAQKHKLVVDQETRWDLQSHGQMTLF